MKLDHIAVASNSEEQADAFFIDLVGMKRSRTFSIPADTVKAIFGVERETRVVRYGGPDLDAEVFITPDPGRASELFTHCCLAVEDKDALADRAKTMGLVVKRIPKKSGEGYTIFIQDFFGNLYEIR